MTQDALHATLDKEIAERDTLIKQVNEEIVFRNGRIAMLQQLLAPAPSTTGETEQITPQPE